MDTTITTILATDTAFTLTAFLADNWGELVLISMVAIKAALNLLPSDKPSQVFSYLDSLVNFWIADKINKKNEE